MQTLLDRHPFLESFFEQLMIRALVSHPVGLAFRVFRLVSVSLLDLLSDIYVIVEFSKDEETVGYGKTLTAMVVSCLVLQALVSVVQHGKKPSRIPLELVLVVTGIKPGVDAYRMCVCKEQDDHEPWSSQVMYSKCGNKVTLPSSCI